MRTAYTTPDFARTAGPAPQIDADLLIVPVFAEDDLADEAGLHQASAGEIERARARGEFTGKLFDQFVTGVTASGWKASRLVLVGAGPRAEFTPDRLRRVAMIGGLAARQRRVARIGVLHREGTSVTGVQAAQVIAEGVCLANYDGGSYKTEDPVGVWLEHARVRVAGAAADDRRRARTRPHAGRVHQHGAGARQRAWQHADAPRVSPSARWRSASAAGLQVEVLDEKRIAALKMGLLLGVARGSQEPPRLVVLRHEPDNAVRGVVLGLVGKGITFDTGGISIKPAENMDKMKDDMSGGAAVICAMAAIAQAEGAGPLHRRRADDREHAGRPRGQAGRRPHGAPRARPSRSSTPTPKDGSSSATRSGMRGSSAPPTSSTSRR